MTDEAVKVFEGVFAVNKPPSLSSAQVLRDLQGKFAKSQTFVPLLEQTEAADAAAGSRSKRRKIDRDNVFKMGHGGTLDPMATGMLIVGIGRGTKHLQSFLDCTKTYETVVLFGKETDTYDIAGKIVAEAAHSHVTKALVESKLEAFRGEIKQVPPIYSALKINGMKAYEYARSGKELPRQLESRSMTVSECTLLDWLEPGKHDFRWPAQEATEEDKAVAQKLLGKTINTTETDGPLPDPEKDAATQPNPAAPEPSNDTNTHPAPSASAPEPSNDTNPTLSSPKSPSAIPSRSSPTATHKATLHTHEISHLSSTPAHAPAVRIRLTVSSGFYVRSFAHDLGIACKSHGTMAELDRSRQGDYTRGSDTIADGKRQLIPALTYEDLEQGEEHWGPKLRGVLGDWMERYPVTATAQGQGQESSRDRRDRRHGHGDRDRNWRGGKSNRSNGNGRGRGHGDRRGQDKRKRNSSSPEA